MDPLSGSLDSSPAGGKGRTKSSAGTGGIGPLMAIPAFQKLILSYIVVH